MPWRWFINKWCDICAISICSIIYKYNSYCPERLWLNKRSESVEKHIMQPSSIQILTKYTTKKET